MVSLPCVPPTSWIRCPHLHGPVLQEADPNRYITQAPLPPDFWSELSNGGQAPEGEWVRVFIPLACCLAMAVSLQDDSPARQPLHQGSGPPGL